VTIGLYIDKVSESHRELLKRFEQIENAVLFINEMSSIPFNGIAIMAALDIWRFKNGKVIATCEKTANYLSNIVPVQKYILDMDFLDFTRINNVEDILNEQ